MDTQVNVIVPPGADFAKRSIHQGRCRSRTGIEIEPRQAKSPYPFELRLWKTLNRFLATGYDETDADKRPGGSGLYDTQPSGLDMSSEGAGKDVWCTRPQRASRSPDLTVVVCDQSPSIR